jgi:hypothetical protein
MKKYLGCLGFAAFSMGAQAAGGFDLSVPRGLETLSFTSPSGAKEICVVPKHLAGADYNGKEGEKDRQSERELCSYNLYLPGPTTTDHGVAACPKVSSTSAAIEFQEIVEPGSKSTLELAASCGRTRATDNLTKFKTSDNDRTCTYAPGAMLTYHLSRYLGDVLQVPAMVLRTVDISTMQKVSTQAVKMSINGLLRKSYQNYIDAYRDPARWDYASWIFTNDYKQHYGYLRDKVKGDSVHPGWVENLSSASFEKLEGVKDAFASTPASSLFGTALSQVALQRLQTARDYADLIVLDQLSSQSDRYSGQNLASVFYYYYKDENQKLKSLEKRKVEKGEKPLPEGALLVRRMVSKDNDCTFLNGNTNAKLGYAARLRHLHPRTYAGVMRLAKAWAADSTVKDFLAAELAMSPKHIATFEKNLISVADSLRANCKSGALKLDLDPEVQLMGAENKASCDAL